MTAGAGRLPSNFVTLEEAVRLVRDGDTLAVSGHMDMSPMALIRETIRAGTQRLRLICVGSAAINADLLIGAGTAASVEFSQITLGEYGNAPHFRKRAEQGAVSLLEHACPTLIAALQAGASDIPFIPVRGLLGTGYMDIRPDFQAIANPYDAGETIAVVPAIRPDAAFFHAYMADTEGNVLAHPSQNNLLLAQAAGRTIVTVERIVSPEKLRAEAGTFIPAPFVTAIACVPFGAHPTSCPGRYGIDAEHVRLYAEASRSEEAFADYLHTYVYEDSGEESYGRRAFSRSFAEEAVDVIVWGDAREPDAANSNLTVTGSLLVTGGEHDAARLSANDTKSGERGSGETGEDAEQLAVNASGFRLGGTTVTGSTMEQAPASAAEMGLLRTSATASAPSIAGSADVYLICALARQLRNGETIAVGNQSPIPAAAALLAKALHAPGANVCILGQPDWPFDGTKPFFDLIQRGGVDVFFLSGGQIDRYGGINLHVIGDYRKPKVRLPGGAGSAVVYFMCRRILLFKTDHTAKGFPERLDFASSVPVSPPDVRRRGRLDGVFTPLGILRPHGEGGALRLTATAPGITAQTVQEHTGFDIAPAHPVAEESAPTETELHVLRTFVWGKLLAIYPEFASRLREQLG